MARPSTRVSRILAYACILGCISQLYDAVLAPSGRKTTQRAILAQIQRSEPTTVGNLAEALVMDAGARWPIRSSHWRETDWSRSMLTRKTGAIG